MIFSEMTEEQLVQSRWEAEKALLRSLVGKTIADVLVQDPEYGSFQQTFKFTDGTSLVVGHHWSGTCYDSGEETAAGSV